MKKPYTINIDAGHGSTTRGKRSPDGSYLEWFGNRKFARALDTYLADTDRLVNNIVGNSPVAIPLKARTEYANAQPRSLFISVHSNASTNKGWGKARGHVVFYYEGSKNGKRLAQCISDRLGKDERIPNRGIKATRKLYVLNKTKSPAVLIERFFHDNKDDLELGQLLFDVQADAVADGIRDFEIGKRL